MGDVLDRSTTRAETAGVLESSTNFRVETESDRDRIVQVLSRQLDTSDHPRIIDARFEATTVPTILRLTLRIRGKSFADAERVTNNFVGSVEDIIDGETRRNRRMSTGIRSA